MRVARILLGHAYYEEMIKAMGHVLRGQMDGRIPTGAESRPAHVSRAPLYARPPLYARLSRPRSKTGD